MPGSATSSRCWVNMPLRKMPTAAENLLSELVDRFPENHEYIHDLATCYVDHGELLKNLGHLDEAERTCHVALQQQDKVPARPGYRQERALTQNKLGVILHKRNRFREADEAFRPALQVLEELTAEAPGLPPYHEELARCLSNRGATLHAMGREQDAESSYTKGATTLLGPLQRHPEVPVYRQELANCFNHLGNLWRYHARAMRKRPIRNEELWRALRPISPSSPCIARSGQKAVPTTPSCYRPCTTARQQQLCPKIILPRNYWCKTVCP